ncbi:MAG: ATP-binding protein [Ignavibacteriales bacterium]|nr:ATP-binding protein [Ignavibacteriales bacterium]
MRRFTLRTVFYILLDVFLIVVCLVHVPYVVQRPKAPFEVEGKDTLVRIVSVDSSAMQAIRAGDLLIRWNSEPVTVPEAVEYLADVSPIGSTVRVEVRRDSQMFVADVKLIPYYDSLRFLIISLFVGLTVFGVGVFILLSRPTDVAARALHWALITLATTTMITWGLAVPEALETYLSRIVWFVSYLGVAVSFLFFTFVFPRVPHPKLARYSWLLLLLVLVIGTAFAFFHLSALGSGSSKSIDAFQELFDIFHISLFVFIGGGLFNLARATLRASSNEERQKMFWVLWGLSIGALPYLVLHILPQVLFSTYLIPEEFTTIFFLSIPIGFSIALLKYRLFDVELLINRTIVYSVLSFFIVVGYGLIVLLAVSIIGEKVVFDRYIIVAGLTLVIGLLINPLRLRLHHVVDEVLFPTRANYRRALTGAVEKLRASLDRDGLFRQLVAAVLGGVRGQMVAFYAIRDGDLALCASEGVGSPVMIRMNEEGKRVLSLAKAVVKANAVRAEHPRVDNSQEEWLSSCGWSVLSPLVSEGKDLLGVVALKPVHAREHYEEEEITFVANVCDEASQILERLILQEKIILAQEARKRSEELSELKSYFISSVSHELRTPLTSIRMFAEMLRTNAVNSRRQQREYLEIIEGESDRLSRLIGNILDFAKIERGVKDYSFAPVRIDTIVKRAELAMRYQFLQHGGKLRMRVERDLPTLEADGDALEEALLNLLSNALKYSIKRKEVDLTVAKQKGKIEIKVADKGIGIPESEIPNIFDRFYRVRDVRTRQIGGAGLGLALVKHIVEAHRGTMSVQSRVGTGTTFVIQLPINRKHRREKQ